jgi:RNA polymerase sigma-70 factor (family 1)
VAQDLLHKDKHLFSLIAEGDEAAFKEIFQRYAHQLLPFLIKLTKSEAQAEEIVQEVFLRVWINRDQLPQIDVPHAWIFRVASNLAYTWLRKMAVESEAIKNFGRTDRTHENDIEATVRFREIKVLMQKAIQKLPAQRRRIYTMHRNEGLKVSEIAEELKISVSTVKNSLLTANKFIREFIENHGHGLVILALLLLN